jgi:murein tripeptide amidase MpaA
LHVTGNFDGGNIRLLGYEGEDGAVLELRADAHSDHRQWFAFRCTGRPGRNWRFRIANAGACDSMEGWRHFRAVASHDGEEWFRVPTRFDGSEALIEFTAELPVAHVAAFALYPLERQARMLARWQRHAAVETIGESVDGRPIDLVTVGELVRDRRRCWIVARQHPSETMAAWTLEGLMERLLDQDDPVSRRLLDRAVFHIVPNANPDGSFRGHTRTNAAGVDLNRAWLKPDARRSPEILAIRSRMQQGGVDFFLDLHGAESVAYCHIVPSEGVPSITAQAIALRHRYEAALLRADTNFQTEHRIPPDPPGEGDLAIGANWVAETFLCLSLTLETPFKDIGGIPRDTHGWSPQLAKRMGAANLDALAAVVEDLR